VTDTSYNVLFLCTGNSVHVDIVVKLPLHMLEMNAIKHEIDALGKTSP